MAVIAQPEVVEKEVEQPESVECIIFDDTHTTSVQFAAPNETVDAEQAEV